LARARFRIKNHHIDLRLSTNLKEIKSDENGKVKSVILEETGEELPCNVVGLTAGVSPNIDFIKNSDIETGRGVKVNRSKITSNIFIGNMQTTLNVLL